MPNVLEKPVFDDALLTMDWTEKLPSGVTISSLDSVLSEKWDGSTSDLTISSSAVSAGSKKTQAKFDAGTLNTQYLIRFQVTYSDGQEREGQGILFVRDTVRRA